jgi:FMN-dependent oxidoreductase (nitrilotriacetate monooxygenase family)
MAKNIHLGLFIFPGGHHIAGWRHPSVPARDITSMVYYRDAAQLAERGKFDLFFVGDALAALERDGRINGEAPLNNWDSVAICSAVSSVTSRIGLVATLSTTYNDPVLVAERFSSLDHLSNGRSGWNIVTTSNDDAAYNFGQKFHLEKNSRYDRAREFVNLTIALWDSWQDDALIADRASGRFADFDRIRRIEHNGQFFSASGRSDLPRPVQGRPVLVQAGTSLPGQDFAASFGELIFTAEGNPDNARKFRAGLHELVRQHGRSPGHVRVMPGLSPLLGSTEREAKRKDEELNDLILPSVGIWMLSDLMKVPLYDCPLDSPLPVAELRKQGVANFSRAANLLDRAEREGLSVRASATIVARARSHGSFVGTPEQLADHMQSWVDTGACDGFNIMPPYFQEQLKIFVDEVVPVLQRRGVLRTEYEGQTLREHLDIPRPGRNAA